MVIRDQAAENDNARPNEKREYGQALDTPAANQFLFPLVLALPEAFLESSRDHCA